MPCSDSSSSFVLTLNLNECLIGFEYAKITCGREITADTGLKGYLKGKRLDQIVRMNFEDILKDVNPEGEEGAFILYMEWDALRCAVAEYLGYDDDRYIDRDRCRVTSVEYNEDFIEIAEVILPPKELPKILPCSLGDKRGEI